MSARNETVIVLDKSLPRERLDIFLRARFPAISRGAMQRLIEQGDIRVDGRPVKATHHPRVGEKIEIHWPDARPATAQPQEIPLDILFEDDDLLVLNKPPAGRAVEKIYHAIVCGAVTPEQGDIRAAIARHPTHRKRMAVTDGRGREAWTGYRVLERLREATLVEALLHTGRTHQIRVHFKHLGFPLVGDATYGNRQNKRLTELTGYAAQRQMLHAHKLAFQHPRAGKKMIFEAPWPEEFKEALTALR